MQTFKHSFMYRRNGFTLIELLVAILIIGALTSAAATSFISAQKQSRDSARKASVNSIATAVETYYARNQKFPGKVITDIPLENRNNLSAYKNCLNIVDNQVTYYYYPLTESESCNSASRVSINGVYDRNEFLPYPAWIPGLGSYLNPFPADTRYQGGDGSSSGDYSNMLKDPDTRSIAYQKLVGGYMIYSKMEGDTSNDSEVINASVDNVKVFSDEPKLPGGEAIRIEVSGIYMIRK